MTQYNPHSPIDRLSKLAKLDESANLNHFVTAYVLGELARFYLLRVMDEDSFAARFDSHFINSDSSKRKIKRAKSATSSTKITAKTPEEAYQRPLEKLFDTLKEKSFKRNGYLASRYIALMRLHASRTNRKFRNPPRGQTDPKIWRNIARMSRDLSDISFSHYSPSAQSIAIMKVLTDYASKAYESDGRKPNINKYVNDGIMRYAKFQLRKKRL